MKCCCSRISRPSSRSMKFKYTTERKKETFKNNIIGAKNFKLKEKIYIPSAKTDFYLMS